LLATSLSLNSFAQDQMVVAQVDSASAPAQETVAPGESDLWQEGVSAYSDSRFKDAVDSWE
ncbi:MAG: hypothetical protein IJJ96_00670, partial [Bacteroidales bacterium]|nr:hypothetical protein [Bacteroidales bacterium]